MPGYPARSPRTTATPHPAPRPPSMLVHASVVTPAPRPDLPGNGVPPEAAQPARRHLDHPVAAAAAVLLLYAVRRRRRRRRRLVAHRAHLLAGKPPVIAPAPAPTRTPLLTDSAVPSVTRRI